MQVDRFASWTNARLSRWNARWRQPGVEAVDAMAQDWSGTWSYVCAPLSMMAAILQLVREQRVKATIIVPWWPRQMWWPVLREMAPNPEQWLRLGPGPQVFRAGPGGRGAVLRRPWEFWAVTVEAG